MKNIYIADQNVMDEWNYLFSYFSYPDDDLLLRYRRTQHAYVLNAYYKDKSIGCVYVFGLKRGTDSKIHGYVARVHVSKKFRNIGIGTKMMLNIIKNFGDCVLHISSASPNRIDGLTDNNREKYRNKLYTFYARLGFQRTSINHTGMIRFPKE